MSVSNSKQVKLLAAAVTSVVTGMGVASQVQATPVDQNAIDVLISRSSDGDVLNGPSGNLNVNPPTYTPSLTGIPYAPGATYDAADQSDSGTLWNTLLTPPSSVTTNSSGAVFTVTFQQNIPLADSQGNATGVQLNLLFGEPNNKSNGYHNSAIPGLPGTGSDGLTANPVGVINQSWSGGGSTDTLIFQLTGLVPNAAYNLYMYGAGPNGGNGGAFSLATANQGNGYGSGAGWVGTAGLGGNGAYLTIPTGGATGTFHSVFSSNGGNNPTPEQGITWVLVPAMADANGNLSIFDYDNIVGNKPYENGFQLQPVIPEPATLGLLGAAAAGVLARRRKRE
jgi:PEP-CTERM motif-containing protein